MHAYLDARSTGEALCVANHTHVVCVLLQLVPVGGVCARWWAAAMETRQTLFLRLHAPTLVTAG